MSENAPNPIERLHGKAREEAETVWKVCRNCGDEILPSAPNMAYCDMGCKKERMRKEMT